MKRLILILSSIATLTAANAQGLLNRQDDTVPAQVELIYERGLRFLAETQNGEGAWNDGTGSEPGVVGLCIAAFLAHGEDPKHGPYAENIRKGLDYIISKQSTANGYIGSSMYNHAFATKALAESYGIIDHPKLADSLKKAVELILSAQKRNRFGGWRYTPESRDADTTVTGCQIVSLFAARNAGMAVPDEAIKKGLAYLASCRGSDGGYGYTSSAGGKPTLTAIGSLCFSLAKEKDSKGYNASLAYLKRTSIIATATIRITTNTTCPRHFSTRMKKYGRSGTREISATSAPSNRPTDLSPGTKAPPSAPQARFYHWP